MAGGSTGFRLGYAALAGPTLFDPVGAAIHSTFWHNVFGVPRSHVRKRYPQRC